MVTRAERIATATAPIIVNGVARTRWAQAARPTRDDYHNGWEASGASALTRAALGRASVTYWWVTALPGEAPVTQGCVLVAETATGATTRVTVPPLWIGRFAAYSARMAPTPMPAAA